MQAVVVHPGDIEEALADRRGAARGRARGARGRRDPALGARSRRRSASAIYHGMYLLRMEEALATDYPGPQALPGRRGLLRAWCATTCRPTRRAATRSTGWATTCPSSWRVAPACGGADFCARPRAPGARAQPRCSTRRRRRRSPRTRSPRCRPRPGRTARLTPIAAFRLLALRYPVSAYLDSLERRAAPAPAAAPPGHLGRRVPPRLLRVPARPHARRARPAGRPGGRRDGGRGGGGRLKRARPRAAHRARPLPLVPPVGRGRDLPGVETALDARRGTAPMPPCASGSVGLEGLEPSTSRL